MGSRKTCGYQSLDRCQQEVDLGGHEAIYDVSLSPDSSKVAVLDDRFVSVYDTSTTQLLYAVPSRSYAIYWRDSNRFVYKDGFYIDGFSLADVTKRESIGLIKTDQVGISSVTGIVDGFLYFVGFPPDVPTEIRDGYRVSVD